MSEVQELIKISRDLIKTLEESKKDSDKKERESATPFDRLLFRVAGVFFVVGFVFFVSNIVTTRSNIAALTEIVKQNVLATKKNHDENGRFLSVQSFIAIESIRNKKIVDFIVDSRFTIRPEELEAARTKGYEKLNEPISLGTTRSI